MVNNPFHMLQIWFANILLLGSFVSLFVSDISLFYFPMTKKIKEKTKKGSIASSLVVGIPASLSEYELPGLNTV